MTDIWSREKRSEVMSKIRSRDTSPERAIKDFLDAVGVGYKHQAEVEGWTVDFLIGDNLVIEYRSCFWHMCEQHKTVPKSNWDYWEPKLRRNRERDVGKDRELREAGYDVEVIWGHDNLKAKLGEIVKGCR